MAAIQKGTELKLSICDMEIEGYLAEDAVITYDADITTIQDCEGETVTKIVTNKKAKLRLVLIVESGTTPDFEVGDAVAVNSITYMLESWEYAYSRLTHKLTLNLVKEESMTYTAP